MSPERRLRINFETGIYGENPETMRKVARCRQTTGLHILEVRILRDYRHFRCLTCLPLTGSAWEFDKRTNEYYLHLFATEQPDLNWENQEVRNAVHSIVRFWLDKGVDGFRLDVINFISNVEGIPDALVTDPDKQWQHGATHYACGPHLHEYLRDLGAIFKEYDAFSVGEIPFVYQPAEILNSVVFDRQELGMVFQFEM